MFLLGIVVVIMLPLTNMTNKAIVLFHVAEFSVVGAERLLNVLLDTNITSYPGFYAFVLFNMRNFTFARRSDLIRLHINIKRNVLGKPIFRKYMRFLRKLSLSAGIERRRLYGNVKAKMVGITLLHSLRYQFRLTLSLVQHIQYSYVHYSTFLP